MEENAKSKCRCVYSTNHTLNFNYRLLFENYVVSKMEFPANCTDGNNVMRAHGDVWTTTAGSCDRRICYENKRSNRRWQINQDCPPHIDYLDRINCAYRSDSTQTFPKCCPYLYCQNREPENTTVPDPSPDDCVDRSPTTACMYWKLKSNCTYSADDLVQRLYNFTVGYCKFTCGFC
ncbi:uncharacterized protein LOC127852728 [Dreissena polymorpha]|uniref:uncharacterized protein LOC127852728 n=1 Tax=Dreissena polymorpha TaxID=45954 RepID=UPI0022655CBB|nr:uncharacterized protein LOC127852728 [Dreissena polymorpha]